jgi:hypothetical protein
MDKTVSGFDWVKARSECSLAKVFQTLRLQVEADVATRKALRTEGVPFTFGTAANGHTFSVFVDGNQLYRTVKFGLTDKAICVYGDDDRLLFEGRVTLSDDGECRLRVGEKELELWQFRRDALEELFFNL